MRGADVKKVQRRLRALHYYPGRPDGEFGPNTLEAVWAFKEVQGLKLSKNPDDIGASMENRLANPRAPKPISRHHATNRIDVSLRGGYLVLYRHGKVRLISHISSGGGYYFCDPPPNQNVCGYAITPHGNFHALSFVPGQVKVPLGEMYNPVFFIGRAVRHPWRLRRPAAAGLAWLRADPEQHRQLLPHAVQDPRHQDFHPPPSLGGPQRRHRGPPRISRAGPRCFQDRSGRDERRPAALLLPRAGCRRVPGTAPEMAAAAIAGADRNESVATAA